MPSRVTIADVARHAGVSTMTVSRVINAKGDVRAETRARVERSIVELAYRPSEVARGLTTRRSRTIGLVVPDITNPFFAEIVRGAEDVAWERQYAVSLTNTVEDPARERAAIEHLEGHRVGGLILCSARLEDDDLAELLRRHPASVLLNRTARDGRSSSLEVDDGYGTLLAVHHLLARGHRRIGLLAGPGRASSARKRRAGYDGALGSAGIAVDAALIEACEPHETGGHGAMLSLLERRPDVEAVVCYNDMVALGALEALRERGRRVPEDVALVGCDDVRLARLTQPPLTTLRTDKYALGRTVATMLFERLAGGPPRHASVKPELVVRASAP